MHLGIDQLFDLAQPAPGDLGDLGGFSVGFASPVFWIAISFNLIFLVILRWSTIYGCGKCDVLIFVPLNTTINIIFSVATGMICLKEYTSAPGSQFRTFYFSLICHPFQLLVTSINQIILHIITQYDIQTCNRDNYDISVLSCDIF